MHARIEVVEELTSDVRCGVCMMVQVVEERMQGD
jgi:hypothetical protein